MPKRGFSACVRSADVAAYRPDEVCLLRLMYTCFCNGSIDGGWSRRIGKQPCLPPALDHDGAICRTDHALQELTDIVAMTGDEVFLASAHIRHQSERQGEFRLRRGIPNLARLAVVCNSKIRDCEISYRRPGAVDHRAGDRDELGTGLIIGGLLRSAQNAEQQGRNEYVLQ